MQNSVKLAGHLENEFVELQRFLYKVCEMRKVSDALRRRWYHADANTRSAARAWQSYVAVAGHCIAVVRLVCTAGI